MKKTVEKLLNEGKKILKDKDIETWALDSEVLLSYVLCLSRVQLITHSKVEVEKDAQRKYLEFINMRKRGVPVQYLTNMQEFMSLPFYVDDNVLIPRNDTEVLVENALHLINDRKDSIILDMCTGSGCIAISMAHYSPESKIFAVDLSVSALKVAKYNTELNKVQDKIFFIESNLFEKVPRSLKGKFDMIISNPPYIPTKDILELMSEVKDYEPIMALDGGDDGLNFYRIIIENSKNYLKNKGILIFEIGYNQGKSVAKLFRKYGFSNITIKKDLAQLDRVIYGVYTNHLMI